MVTRRAVLVGAMAPPLLKLPEPVKAAPRYVWTSDVVATYQDHLDYWAWYAGVSGKTMVTVGLHPDLGHGTLVVPEWRPGLLLWEYTDLRSPEDYWDGRFGWTMGFGMREELWCGQ